MKNFNIKNMQEDTIGSCVLPFETPIYLSLNLRNFYLMLERQFSAIAVNRLQDHSEVKMVMHDGSQFDDPFFAVSFKMTMDSCVDASSLLDILSYCNVYQKRGRRAVFMSENKNKDDGQFFNYTFLIGKNVYYSDFRVTVNYPSSEHDMDVVIQDLGERLSALGLEFELENV